MLIRVSLMLTVLCTSLHAQDFPSRPITVLEPLAPGAGVDAMMRLFSDVAARELGQPVIVSNRTGGGGVVAAVAAKNAPPDGYTLFHAHNGTQAILPAIQTVPYDPIGDFEPITQLFGFAPYLIVPASLPVKTAAELADLARKTPGGLRFGSPGVGSSPHLLAAMWDHDFKVPFRHIPYRGAAEMLTDLIAGRVDYTFSGILAVHAQIASGQLRVLAIGGKEREDPTIPTMAEAGFPGLEGDAWFALAAPAGTPKVIINKLNAAFRNAAIDPILRARAKEIDYRLMTSTPEESRAVWVADQERWRTIARSISIEAN